MKTVKILLAGIACMLLSVSAFAQMPSAKGCDATTTVNVNFFVVTFLPSPITYSVVVEWKFIEDPSWMAQKTEVIHTDTNSPYFSVDFAIPVCEKEVASMCVKVYRGDLLPQGFTTAPVLLSTQCFSSYVPNVNFGL